MSVEVKENGNLRLRCACRRKFVPRTHLQDAARLRERAELYGWSVFGGADRCPECSAAAAFERPAVKVIGNLHALFHHVPTPGRPEE